MLPHTSADGRRMRRPTGVNTGARGGSRIEGDGTSGHAALLLQPPRYPAIRGNIHKTVIPGSSNSVSFTASNIVTNRMNLLFGSTISSTISSKDHMGVPNTVVIKKGLSLIIAGKRKALPSFLGRALMFGVPRRI